MKRTLVILFSMCFLLTNCTKETTNVVQDDVQIQASDKIVETAEFTSFIEKQLEESQNRAIHIPGPEPVSMCYIAAVGFDVGCDGNWPYLTLYETYSSAQLCWDAIDDHIQNNHNYQPGPPIVCGGIPEYACQGYPGPCFSFF